MRKKTWRKGKKSRLEEETNRTSEKGRKKRCYEGKQLVEKELIGCKQKNGKEGGN